MIREMQEASDSERARLVEVLWNLKQGFRKYGTGSLRLTAIQFSWLLNDSDYRNNVIKRAENSEGEATQSPRSFSFLQPYVG